MKEISVVIITLNEEKNIARCINSVADIADEVLVVDSHSTDNTRTISEELGARVIETDWMGYSDTKNMANAKARCDYILSLDADEALSDNLRKNILEQKEKGFPHDIYELDRLTNFCGKWIRHGGWYPDKKYRLWKKGLAEWSGIIHEELVWDKRASVGHLRGFLLHYAFNSISQHIDQINSFSDLAAQDAFNKGKNAGLLKLCFSPAWKFFRDFIIRRGFLDGYYGYVIARNSAHAKFLKYAKLRESYK